ncbi:MAG: hypothetical protein Q9195_009614 [Heterodermia aff. obscurata]
MSVCQQIAESWNLDRGRYLDQHMRHDRYSGRDLEDRDRKALTIVTDAYGEWSEDTSAQRILHTALISFPASSESEKTFMAVVRQTAEALAADRSTKLLPIAVALFFFIGAVGIAIFRTAAAARNSVTSDTVFINVEAHSIAFSALYFWIIPAVFLSSIIGVSQTEAAIPRILRRFQEDLARMALPEDVMLPRNSVDDDGPVLSTEIKRLNGCLEDKQKRVFHGGVYSWLPSNRQLQSLRSSNSPVVTSTETTSNHNYEPIAQDVPGMGAAILSSNPSTLNVSRAGSLWGIRGLVPYSSVILGTVAGCLVSGLVPPVGFDCRHIAEILICIIWILSAQADHLLRYLGSQDSDKRKTLFWWTFAKDFVAMALTMGGIILTQVGYFNRCSCYTNWGKAGLALPQMPDVARVLIDRLNMDYPLITFLSIGIELIFVPIFISIQYPHAFRVFVQRDDGKSNASWLWKIHRMTRACKESFSDAYTFRSYRRSRFNRAVTTSGESGNRDESIEMRILAQSQERESIQEEADVADHPRNPNTNAENSSEPFESKTSSRESTWQLGTDPRRRNTEQTRAEDETSRIKNPRDEKLLHRKPLPGNSPLQYFTSRP